MKTQTETPAPAKPVCGLVMPISRMEGCDENHWLDVRGILSEAISAAGFDANMVSDADDVGIIQKRIIQNLYENPIVVCDVSGKNPNVMFELGMRLAFDKPTIIVKDDKTTYSFDTSPIEHLEYPRDLRYSEIVDFKEELADKIKGTYEKAAKDRSYTTFLKHFGTFTVAKISTEEVETNAYILEEIKGMRAQLSAIQIQPVKGPVVRAARNLCMHNCKPEDAAKIVQLLTAELGVVIAAPRAVGGTNHFHIPGPAVTTAPWDKVLSIVNSVSPTIKARLL